MEFQGRIVYTYKRQLEFFQRDEMLRHSSAGAQRGEVGSIVDMRNVSFV